MKLLPVLVCLFAAPALQAQTSAARSPDDAAIRTVIRNYMNARDARDLGVIEGFFTADADQYTTAGEWRRGRAQVVAGTAESTKQNPGARSIDVAAIRYITPDVAIADGDYIIAGSTQRRWTTIVLKRDAGTWRIAAVRNMTPTSAPARTP